MSTSGVFIAPKSGKYFFSYSGISEVNAVARVELQIKTDTADWTRVGLAYGHQVYFKHTFLCKPLWNLYKATKLVSCY